MNGRPQDPRPQSVVLASESLREAAKMLLLAADELDASTPRPRKALAAFDGFKMLISPLRARMRDVARLVSDRAKVGS